MGLDVPAGTEVLVASAQERVHSACRQELCGEGIHLIHCRGAVECLEHLRQRSVDVLVLDASLPWGGADGLLDLLSTSSIDVEAGPLIFLVATEVISDLLYRVGRYRVDDFQIGLHEPAKFGNRVRRLAYQRGGGTGPRPASGHSDASR